MKAPFEKQDLMTPGEVAERGPFGAALAGHALAECEAAGIHLWCFRERLEGESNIAGSAEMEPSETMERMLRCTPPGCHRDDAWEQLRFFPETLGFPPNW